MGLIAGVWGYRRSLSASFAGCVLQVINVVCGVCHLWLAQISGLVSFQTFGDLFHLSLSLKRIFNSSLELFISSEEVLNYPIFF